LLNRLIITYFNEKEMFSFDYSKEYAEQYSINTIVHLIVFVRKLNEIVVYLFFSSSCSIQVNKKTEKKTKKQIDVINIIISTNLY